MTIETKIIPKTIGRTKANIKPIIKPKMIDLRFKMKIIPIA
ncbi:MAG: hypothetical protein QXL69_05985 [Candidatus Bathyarchaeia archaeon]